jgi:hypothetical protein
MKRVLLVLILMSPVSLAEWGATYICTMTHNSALSAEGKYITYHLENFTFQMNEEKRAFVFGDSSMFKEITLPIDKEFSYPHPRYEGRNNNEVMVFEEGKFLFGSVYSNIQSVTADCDKFE